MNEDITPPKSIEQVAEEGRYWDRMRAEAKERVTIPEGLTAEETVRSWAANGHDVAIETKRVDLDGRPDIWSVSVSCADIVVTKLCSESEIERHLMRCIEEIRINSPGPGSIELRHRFNPDEPREPA